MPRPVESTIAGTRWTVRLIPLVLLGAFGFATYAVPAYLCVDYLYRTKGQSGTAAALLVLYFLFFILSIACYLRTFLTVQFDPALVPLTPERETRKTSRRRHRGRGRDIESEPWVPPDSDPDSPGLESFYSKDVFICQSDGRPKWCSDCRQWKPDRVSHSSELQRCVRKMDHLCPWAGGMVSETSFNFFVQFVFYCTFYCAVCLSTAAYCLHLQIKDGLPLDGRPVAILALAGLFGLFTFGMVMTCVRFLVENITNVDMVKKRQVYTLAVRIPHNTAPSPKYRTITYPLPNEPAPPMAYGLNGQADGTGDPVSTRDHQATKTFAILSTEPGENPWDLGYWRNFKTVMGGNIVEWLLPIKHSPCCNHDDPRSMYELGPLITTLKRRYGIPDGKVKTEHGIEMHDAGETRERP